MNGFMAAFSLRCPQCRRGALFRHGTYRIKFMDMYTRCPACGLTFEIEPGFFWGAMYISYAVTIAISTISAILIYLVSQSANVWLYVGIIVGALIVLAPYNFRLSRALMLYLFSPIHYDPSALQNSEKAQ